MRALQGRAVRTARSATITLLVVAAAGCSDLLFVAPAPAPAGIALSYSLSSAVTADMAAAFDQADRVRITVTGPGVALDTVIVFAPAAEVRLPLEVTGVQDGSTYQIGVELRRGDDVLFVSSFTTQLAAGRTTEAAVTLNPVPAGIRLPAEAMTTHFLGEPIPLLAAVLFASGDTIPGGSAPITWTTSNAAVASVNAQGVVTPHADGTAIITARSGTAEASITITVLATITVTPKLRNIVTTSTSQNSHVCALRPDGSVLCWGDNVFGQLGIGDPDVVLSREPVAAASGHTFIGLSSGINHKCGLKASGEAWCWGNNVQGQLGAGTGPHQFAPIQVSGGHNFVDINSHGNTTCAVTEAGAAYCWGNNFLGQLGTGNTTDSHTPARVNTAASFATITTGGGFSCALTPQGQAYCWGDNRPGILGDGTVEGTILTPQPVATALRFKALQAYSSIICGLDIAGRAHCWGYSYTDEGFGGAPTDVSGGHNFASLGANFGVGIKASGAAFSLTSTATPLHGDVAFSELSLGYPSCGISTGGAALCWGGVRRGALGNGEWEGADRPVQVAGTGTFSSVQSGFFFSCALATDGAAHCWGANNAGQLGRGFVSPAEGTPAPVSGGLPFTSLSTGPTHACGVSATGAVYCWGSNGSGQIGDSGDARAAPARVPGDHVYRSVHAGANHTCAISTTDDVYCWGANGQGQFGTGSTAGVLPVTHAAGGMKFQTLATANAHTCGIGTDGITRCWGRNLEGAVGDGTFTNRLSPTPVASSESFVKLALGVNTVYSCGITASGTALCWGRNAFGMLGDGTFTNRNVPTAVLGGHTFSDIAAGDNTTCAVRTDGSSYCWGPNHSGQYGAGTIHGNRATPQPAFTSFNLARLSVGNGFVCGVTTVGAIHCAGSRDSGRLGDGAAPAHYASPLTVLGGHAYRR
jgi:alpha-tubulin suppressor-like RCC1 family protein